MDVRFQLRPLPTGLRVRAYNHADLPGCMAVFASNRGFTLPEDSSLMERHLSDVFVHYLVIEGPEGILACGGIDPRGDINRADLCFGMVHRSYHRRGLGTLLLLCRLALVDCSEGEVMVFLETSHKTEGFYRRFGFEPVSGYEARYGPGLNYLSLGYWLFPEVQKQIRDAISAVGAAISLEYEGLKRSV